jgi:actin, other eukaryote
MVYPVERATIPNYDAAARIWEHILFKDLGAYKNQFQVLLSDNPNIKKQNRSQLAEIFFEKLAADSISIMNGACLSLFSTGKTSGLVVEIGEGATHTVPIFEGYALQHAALTNDIAGQDITLSVIDSLAAQGKHISREMYDYGRDIKEKMCSIPMDYTSAVTDS